MTCMQANAHAARLIHRFTEKPNCTAQNAEGEATSCPGMGNACSKSPDASAGQRDLEISPARPPDARDLGDVGVDGLGDMIVDAADNVGDLLTGLHNTAAGLASGLVDGLVDDQDSLAGIDENLGVNAGLTSSRS